MKNQRKLYTLIVIIGITIFCLTETFQRSIEANISNKPLLLRFFLGEFTYGKEDVVVPLFTLIQLFAVIAVGFSIGALLKKKEQ